MAGGRFAANAISKIAVTPSGLVDLGDLRTRLASGPAALVSIMAANNETGALQPIREAARIVHEAGGLLHVDAIQALGKLPLDIKALGADVTTLSAHKIGGPKGVGALVLSEGLLGVEPLLRGGGQERGHRAGTENVAGIAGFGAAAKAAVGALEADRPRLEGLRDRLEAGLRQTPGAIIFSRDVPRLPNTTLFTVPGLRAVTAVIGFDLAGVAVSSGSACSSGKVQPSHVLEAMGFGPKLAEGAVRLSLGWSTTETDIDSALQAWRKLEGTLIKGSDETQLERF
jgi:cysteine desulfurase